MSKNNRQSDTMSKLVALCKRRGIVFPSSEIYGGVGSTYDYGPYGVEIKNNIARLWWREMTYQHDNIVGLDSAIILHPKVWEASGHIAAFNDPLVECQNCKKRFRDEFNGELECPACGMTGTLGVPRQFNLMFKSSLGAVAEDSDDIYFRPETCQGIYLDYKIVQESARLKVPFGIAQIGKAFRNEIVARNFIFRTREFEQMEMQFFIKPGDSPEQLKYWLDQRLNWHQSLGIPAEHLRTVQHPPDKRAHYARDAWDIEYLFPFGWGEIEGVHDRGDWDLSQHQKFSGKDLTYYDDELKQRYIPHIVETSAGLNRTMLMVLCEAYREDEQAGESRVYLALDPKIAPIKAAILPLVKKDGLMELGESIYRDLRGQWPLFFDESGSIGRRYRRMDEIGTPFCFTVDYQTKADGTVTVRWRDTLAQERIPVQHIGDYLARLTD